MRAVTAAILLILLVISCKDVKSPASLVRLPDFPSQFVQPRHIDVWLPPNYPTQQQYPVLYMHDGQMLFDSTTTWNGQEWGVDEVMEHLISSGQIRPAIVVAIHNIDSIRHANYFPQKPFESLAKQTQDSLYTLERSPGRGLFGASVDSDQYLRFIVDELKPFIDKEYATLPDPAHTFIMGSSMGGLISMYAISEYPEVFGGAACLSTHWPGIFTMENNPIPKAFYQYVFTNLPDPATHKLYFDFGTATLDALYEPLQLKVDSIIQSRGYTSENWITQKFEGHPHDEKAWRSRLHIPLTFLLNKHPHEIK